MTVPGTPSPEAIRSQLERILSSPDFKASNRLKKFLRFIVDETLAGRADLLKGYTVAVDVFGRPENFDPKKDPIVSVESGRLRRALELYYLSGGRNDTLRIDVPRGGYIAKFTPNGAPHQKEQTEPSCLPNEQPVPAPIIPGHLSIAVLPFEYRGGDADAEYLADGITDELITGLSRFQGMTVIARQSTLHYRGQRPAPEEVLRMFGARFVLNGSVSKIQDSIRVTANLTDTTDAKLLWAERFQQKLSAAGLFDIQDEITQRIVLTVGNDYGVILRRLVKDTQGKRPSDLNAYEATLLYHHYHTTFGLEAHARALAAIERAVELDPQYAVGWAQLICLYGDVYALGYAGPEDALERAAVCARQALALNPECQEVRSNTAFIRFLSHQHADAIRHADKAIELNPNNANFVCHSGFYIGLSGELDRGRKIIDDVWRLNPFLPGWLRTVAFVYHLVRAEYEAAFREARRFRIPNMAWDPLLRAASAGYLDNRSAMIKAYRELTEQFPDVASNPTETIRKYFHFDQWVDAMLKGLEMAKSAAR